MHLGFAIQDNGKWAMVFPYGVGWIGGTNGPSARDRDHQIFIPKKVITKMLPKKYQDELYIKCPLYVYDKIGHS